MIDLYKTLKNKTEELENRLLKLEKKTISDNSGIMIISSKLLNYEVISRKMLSISNINNTEKKQILFQLKLVFYNTYTQNIKFALYANKIQIAAESNNFQVGNGEIIISGMFQDLISEKINISVSIFPENNKLVTINSSTLNIWGLNNTNASYEYCALETTAKYYLSYISNNRLYIKSFNKSLDSEDFDFSLKTQALSHSLCFDNDNNTIYLLYVDTNNNLFFKELDSLEETFITNNVSKVSACYSNNKIQFSYISNQKCHIGEILNNVVISNKIITGIIGNIADCYLYFNNLNNKCYLILTKSDNTNYLFESINESCCITENISAQTTLSISTEDNL